MNARDIPWGSFRTSGRRALTGDSWVVVDDAYVQFHAPTHPRHEIPILFVHGGGLSGTMWEHTPDGRPGWAPHSNAAGWPVFVIDTVDAARSGEAPPETRDGDREFKTARQIWERYRIGRAEDWPGSSSLLESRFPFAHFDTLVAAHVPRRRTTDEVELTALIEAISTIGRPHVVAHSHGAVLAARAAHRVGIASLALIEPLPFPSLVRGGPETLLVWGDFLSRSPIWTPLISEYASAPVTRLALPEAGLPGNTHVPMCDLTSDAVLDQILRWIAGLRSPPLSER